LEAPLETEPLHITVAVGASLKERHLDISVAVGGPCETGILSHYSWYWERLSKQSTYTLQLLYVGALWKQSVVDNPFKCRVGSIHIAVAGGAPSKAESRLPTLKHIAVYDDLI